MSARPDSISLDTLVSEALARMKEASAAAPSYEVDRTRGQWIVRRASTTSALFAGDVVAEAMAKTRG